MLGLEGRDVHSSNDGWEPVSVEDNLSVMSIGFLLNNKDDAVIWRGPRKTGLCFYKISHFNAFNFYRSN